MDHTEDRIDMKEELETIPLVDLRGIAAKFGISEFRPKAERVEGVSSRRDRDELIRLLAEKGIRSMGDAETVTAAGIPKPAPKRERPKPPAAPGTKIEPGDPDPAQDGTALVDIPVPPPQSGQVYQGNPDLVDGYKLAQHLRIAADAIDAARRAGVISYTRSRGPALVSGGVPVPPRVMQGLYRISEVSADARAWLRSWVSPVRTEAAPQLNEQDPLLPARQLADEYGISERELLRLISTGSLPAWPLLQADGTYRWHSLPSAFRHVAAQGRLVSL